VRPVGTDYHQQRLYESDKVGAMAQVILHRVAQRDELARLRVFLHRQRMLFEGLFGLHNVCAKKKKQPVGKFRSGPSTSGQGSRRGDSDDGGHC